MRHEEAHTDVWKDIRNETTGTGEKYKSSVVAAGEARETEAANGNVAPIKVARKCSHSTVLPDGAAARSKLTNRDQAAGPLL
jgi:hypothetical protein